VKLAPGLTWKQNLNRGGSYHFGQPAPGLAWKARQSLPKPASRKTGPFKARATKSAAPKTVFCTWCHGKHAIGSKLIAKCRREQSTMSGVIDVSRFTGQLFEVVV
jgi:hypothetical protein